MPKIDLLPCPFCGKIETLRIMCVPSEKHELVYHVVCDSVNGGCGAATGWNHGAPEEAAKEWNTRASGWIPCSERLPGDGLNVLVYDSYGNEQLIAWYDKKKEIGWHESTADFPLHDISDWMPLPKAPKRKDDAE